MSASGRPYEFSDNQWLRRHWSPFWRRLFGTWDWKPAAETALPPTRKTFTEDVNHDLVAPVDTPVPDILLGEEGRITLPRPYKGYPVAHLPGTPYQVGDSRNGWVTLREFSSRVGIDRPVKFPKPVDHNGRIHYESAPTPGWVSAQGGWADNHVCVYDRATGHFHEAIGYNAIFDTVAAFGEFDENGDLVDGRGVIWSKHPIGPYIFDLEHDQPHSLLFVASMAAGGDEDPPQFPWVGRVLTLSEEAKGRIPDFPAGSPMDRFARSVAEHPIIMSDHGGGNSFRWRYGSKAVMESLDWKGWDLHITDLVPADGKTGF